MREPSLEPGAPSRIPNKAPVATTPTCLGVCRVVKLLQHEGMRLRRHNLLRLGNGRLHALHRANRKRGEWEGAPTPLSRQPGRLATPRLRLRPRPDACNMATQ